MRRLRDETAEQHRHTERRPLVRAMLRGELSEAAFQHKLWGYRELHGLAAERLDPVSAGLLRAMVRTRRAHLCADLTVSLAPLPSELWRWREALKVPEGEAALGWLYVLEGSSLGAQVLLDQLAERYPSGLLHYYRGHGEQTRAYWASFSRALGRLVTAPDRCVDGARNCFAAVSDLFAAVMQSQAAVG